ncbi:MAG: MFS transporter [Galactobacter sp.]
MTSTTGTPPTSSKKEVRKVILSSYLGSAIEYYDFLLYATASALVFPHVFFTDLSPVAGTIASYGTFAAGYLARPLGGAIFGHFGDKLGRKKMLILSMVIMGIASTLIGCVPGADTIGSWGAIILIFLRICQGIAVGGEWGGAALMALEHTSGGKRGFAASFTNAGAPTGAALGTFIMGIANSSMSEEAFLSWGWRVPFLISFILLIVGLIIRATVSESPLFLAAMKEAEKKDATKPKLPLWQVLKAPKPLIFTMLAGCSGFALQVVQSTFAVGYATDHGLARPSVLYVFAAASIISIAFVLGFARLSDTIGRRPMMITGLVLFIAYMYPMFWLLRSGNLFLVFLAFTVSLALHAMMFGPLAAFVAEQFGTSERYTGASLGYQLATLLGAGFTPTIITALYGSSQNLNSVLFYLIGLCIVSIVFILLTRETKDRDLMAERV